MFSFALGGLRELEFAVEEWGVESPPFERCGAESAPFEVGCEVRVRVRVESD